jgi:hypothetical protein
MNMNKVQEAAIVAKAGTSGTGMLCPQPRRKPAWHPNGMLNKDFGIDACIAATVLGYVEDEGFGEPISEMGKKTSRWWIDLSRIVEILDGQITRDEILRAVDRLVMEDKVRLWPGDGGITVEPLFDDEAPSELRQKETSFVLGEGVRSNTA